MRQACPNCKTEYDLYESGKYECGVCHQKFIFVQPNQDRTEIKTLPEQNENICPFCKLEIPADAKKCGHCGEWISGKKPVDRSIYLTLSFLFGNFGVAEIYAGNIKVGIFYFIANFLGIIAMANGKAEGIIGIIAFWVIQFTLAIFTEQECLSKEKNIKTKTSIIEKILNWIMFIVVSFVIIGLAIILMVNKM